MKSQETPLIQMSEQEKIRLQRIQNLKNLIENITDSMPLPVKTMVTMYHGTVQHLLDNLTFEQTEQIIEKAQNFVDALKGNNDVGEIEL